MADNYLEKKMEQHKARAVSATASKRCSLFSLLEHCVAPGAFDAYVVREDQLVRLVGAAARVAPLLPFYFRLVAADEASRLRSGNANIPKATAYIAVCPCENCEVDYILLGRVLQAMLLQAAEIGLCGAFLSISECKEVVPALSLPCEPLAVVAFGRSAEPLLSFETSSLDFDISSLIIRG